MVGEVDVVWRDATVCRSAPIVLVLTLKGRLTVGSGMVSSIGLSAIEAGTYHLLLDYGTNRKPARRSALVASPGGAGCVLGADLS